jgi:hypothetical protein
MVINPEDGIKSHWAKKTEFRGCFAVEERQPGHGHRVSALLKEKADHEEMKTFPVCLAVEKERQTARR